MHPTEEIPSRRFQFIGVCYNECQCRNLKFFSVLLFVISALPVINLISFSLICMQHSAPNKCCSFPSSEMQPVFGLIKKKLKKLNRGDLALKFTNYFKTPTILVVMTL